MNKADKNSIQTTIKKPIFVVGCCNSGTTILWRTLLNHPDINGPIIEGQDLKDIPRYMKHYLGKKTFRLFAHPKFDFSYHLTEKDYTDKRASTLSSFYSRYHNGAKRFIEKSPANSMRTRFLQSIFPDSYFLIIVRNGYAVSEGIVRKRLYDPDRPHMAGLKTTIKEAAEQWYNANRILMDDIQHLKKSLVVKYEDLVKNTNETIFSVLKFCDCESLNFQSPKLKNNLNAVQIKRLSVSDKETIYNVSYDMLTYFGYA